MSFASLEFCFFMCVVYVLYRLMSHRWQNRMLLVASYVFYGAWDWRFLGLILIATIINYTVGLALARTAERRIRRALVFTSAATSLGILCVFKYFNFFVASLGDLLATFGVDPGWSTLNIVLPVGISFYTFQAMGYAIDVYYRKIEPSTKLLDFALFVAFFPQLVAGPIERAANLLPRVLNPRTISLDQTTRGAYLILFGLLKKIVVADGLAQCVDAVYGLQEGVGGLSIILATYLFALQIYCDFSGYSDVARGLAKILGFDLMTNFRLPYFATNPREFWDRWHISLSTWLRDYLYIPLGGNRGTKWKTYRNLMITMILGGLWHGAAWNFALWGVYQGAVLCLFRVLGLGSRAAEPCVGFRRHVVRLIQAALFFQVTCYGWLLFRASSLAQIVSFTKSLVSDFWGTGIHVPAPSPATLAGVVILLSCDFLQYCTGSPTFYRHFPSPLRGLSYASCILVLLMGMCHAPAQFIYFQF